MIVLWAVPTILRRPLLPGRADRGRGCKDFPADYPFQGRTKQSLYRQVGNSAPPRLAAAVVRAVHAADPADSADTLPEDPMPTTSMKPFWRYYGGKWRAAPRYPAPEYPTIIEPFAGAAGYALRYHDRNVILVEKYPIVAEMWRYLIGVKASEIRAIPTVVHVADLPTWVPAGARHLIGFCMNAATVSPCRQLSAGRIRLAAMGRKFEGWSEAQRERVASQVERIRHWRIIEGNYTSAPDIPATWFVDPPYNNTAGSYYIHGPSALDYTQLGKWCRERPGQVLVCENEGASWLPFQPFATLKPGLNGKGSREVLWVSSASPAGHAPVPAPTPEDPMPPDLSDLSDPPDLPDLPEDPETDELSPVSTPLKSRRRRQGPGCQHGRHDQLLHSQALA